ncbi:MAG: 2-succinyl-6-hydroxy-2,4-cyclohexadiene-1-carboxylate synthase [Chloroflexi bacterium RBG_16_72_14]|nr:MAG: 2-succinyl-6-hydroxy-2,4-cyclohexadiene-1-carboxylate synthase [Chloroflexi bacterium RBG_16_72_14]
MSAIVVDGLRWEVRARGEGRPLLLLHGFTGRGTSWGSHATSLARRFRAIVVDLPGHGRSGFAEPARLTVERTADDLAAILARLGAAPAHILGYSLGARVALRLTVAHPAAVDRLVLESPSAGIGSDAERAERRAADEALAARLERDGIADFVTAWERNPVFQTHAALHPAVAARQRAIRLANDPRGLAASLRGAGQGAMEPLFDRLRAVTTPTLVIAGALDDRGRPRAERVAAGIPGARLAVLDGVGHTPHLEQPARFHRLVLDFLQEVPAA